LYLWRPFCIFAKWKWFHFHGIMIELLAAGRSVRLFSQKSFIIYWGWREKPGAVTCVGIFRESIHLGLALFWEPVSFAGFFVVRRLN